MTLSNAKTSVFALPAKMDRHNLLLLSLLLAFGAAMSIIKPQIFPTWENLNSMLMQVADIGLLSAGMLLSFLIGGIDLSVVSTSVLSATVAGFVILRLAPAGTGLAIITGFAVAILTGLICGAINGLLIAKVKLPSILATLGTNALYRGVAIGITGGVTIGNFPQAFADIGSGTIGGVYYVFFIFVVLIILVHIYIRYTGSGFQAALIGNNAKAAYFSGIDNTSLTIVVHTVIGGVVSVAGMIMMSRANSINPDYGVTYLLQSILVCVIANVDINGGKAKIFSLVLALLLMQLISTSFNMLMLGYSGATFFKNIVWGFLLIALLVYQLKVGQKGGRSRE